MDKLRWGSFVYYTLYFSDGHEFTIEPAIEVDLLDKSARSELEALPEGKKVTVIASQEGDVCAFWTDDHTFISLDDYNARARKNKLYLFIVDASLFLVAVPLEVLYWFDAFRQLRISLGKQRRKAKRKHLRSELKNTRKEP